MRKLASLDCENSELLKSSHTLNVYAYPLQNLLSSLLVHLDKVYHSSFSDPNILRSRAMAKFKSIVWQDTVIHRVIIDDIFKWLSEERQTGT